MDTAQDNLSKISWDGSGFDDVNIYLESNINTNSCTSFTSRVSLSVFTEGWSLKVVVAHGIIIYHEQQHAGTTDVTFL